jgi:hypothetical protein
LQSSGRPAKKRCEYGTYLPKSEILRVVTSLLAGTAYFTSVFALGFLLGVVRVLFLERRLGATLAIACELPIILGFSWLAAGWIIDWLGGPSDLTGRLLMGGSAFVILMVAEAALASFSGRSLKTHLERYRTLPGALGLAGQLVFAIIPVAQGWPAMWAVVGSVALIGGWIAWRRSSRRHVLPRRRTEPGALPRH